MPTVILTRDDDGHLKGLSDRDEKAYAKFLARIKAMTSACSLLFTWREPRSGPYHRRHFAMLNSIFESQEQFEDPDDLRKWLEVGAGYCKFVPGPTGRMVALPESISYDKLDQAQFEIVHDKVFRFARTEHALQFLWPHLTEDQAYNMMDVILRSFE